MFCGIVRAASEPQIFAALSYRFGKLDAMKVKLTDSAIRANQSNGEHASMSDTLIPGFMARFWPSGTVSFAVQYSPRDQPKKRLRYTIGKWPSIPAASAREMARDVLKRVAMGENPQAERIESRAEQIDPLTLRVFLRDYYAVRRMKKQINTEDYIGRISNYYAPLLDKPLASLTLRDAEQCRIDKKNSATVRTINQSVTLFKAALRLAIEWELIEPLPWIHKFKKWPVNTDKRPRFLNRDEWDRLVAVLDEWEREHINGLYQLYAVPLVLLGLHAGLRRAEALHLRREGVCFETKMITLNPEDTKGRKLRHVPMNPLLLDAMKRHADRFPSRRDEFFESHYNAGAKWGPNKYLDDYHFAPAWAEIKARAGLEAGFRYHDLRHSFASWLVMTGTDIYTVSSLLGHSSVKQTEVYAHLAPDFKRAAVERL